MLYLNDSLRELTPMPETIEQLLIQLSLEKKRLIIEHNGTVISPEKYDVTFLTDRDRIEIIHFVGGG
ncbi:sulfur carrier protein ThiS [Thermoactinomyces sp. DSM 45892]|uniref:sulfur carrier protein ThiS n=1 Tax=Thermoactinomyces sp. DSM 45892 TaxID=1882753 RepID=UPI00089CC9EE|nr:sulfur carrier protein ThiS [Thermoactinomyces sp. DSM 45892]SDZ03759.1 sulfur carrier protein [Thermoactinomyces sp. DSM 45892]